jgi:hypothetical protein
MDVDISADNQVEFTVYNASDQVVWHEYLLNLPYSILL